jgi:protein SDA1
MDLQELQRRCRRDASAYAEEFRRQRAHLDAQLAVFALQPENYGGTGGGSSSSSGPSASAGGAATMAAAAAGARKSRGGFLGGAPSQRPEVVKRQAQAQKQVQREQAAVAQQQESKTDRAASKNLRDLAMFVCQCSDVYRDECRGVGPQLVSLLERSGAAMARDIRQALVSALMVLRSKNVVAPMDVLPVFFRLLKCGDRELRASLRGHIVADVRACNAKRRDNALNNALQGFLFSVVEANDSDLGSKMAVDILIDLYHRNVWRDTKTVNAISKGIFSRSSKVVTATLRFFLGERVGGRSGDDSDSDDDGRRSVLQRDRARLISDANHMLHNGSKNTKSKKRRREKALKHAEKLGNKADTENDPNFKVNWPALELLYDPQNFAERAFGALRGSNERFEVRLMLMNLISRLIGLHKLDLPNFYPFLQRYLRPRQDHITYILVSLAQAVHENVLPETLEPVIRALADNFVADRCEPEAVAAGLNTIHAITSRNPLVIPDDDPAGIVRDLTAFTRHRDRNVVQAARALVNLFRTINPELLKRKDRGKPGTSRQVGVRPLKYGERAIPSNVDGIELLEMLDEYKRAHGDVDDAEAWAAITGEVEGEGSDSGSSGDEAGWVNVSHSGDEGGDGDEGWVEVSDDDDDETGGKLESDGDESGSDDDDSEGIESDGDGDGGEEDAEPTGPRLDQTRILTQTDFDRLKRLKKLRSEGALGGGKPSRKRGIHALATQEVGLAGVVIDQGDIEGMRKRAKMDYDERMAHMAADREDGVTFSHAAKRAESKGGGSTNIAKKKTKVFSMIRQKREVREKLNRGTNEKLRAKQAKKKKRY